MIRTITVNSIRGAASVQSTLTARQAYDILDAKQRKTAFEEDLLRDARTYGDRLLVGRQNWLIFLAEQSRTLAPAQTVGDLTAIMALFGRARQHLKFPKIRLATESGAPVVLSLAGSRSAHAGTISVTTGEPLGTPGSFYGRVSLDGSTTVRNDGVLSLLRAFALDPAGVAASYGRAHGECCFCKGALSNGKQGSASVGYGPDCAKSYDLPWEPNGSGWELGEDQAVKASESPAAAFSAPDVAEAAGTPLDLTWLVRGCSKHVEDYSRLPAMA